MSTTTATRPTTKKAAPGPRRFNTAWFRGKIIDLKLTQAGMARAMDPPMDPSAMSRLLQGRGERRMQIHEASQIAKMFGCSIDLVIEHAGIDVPTDAEGRVPIVGRIDENGYVHRRGVAVPRVIRRPEGVSVAGEAFRYQVDGASNGWTLFVEGGEDSISSAACIDKFCIVKDDSGIERVMFVRRGYSPGQFNLSLTAKGPQNPAAIVGARPVLWIKCA